MTEISLGGGATATEQAPVAVECNGDEIGRVSGADSLTVIKEFVRTNLSGVKSIRVYADTEELDADDLEMCLNDYVEMNGAVGKFVVCATTMPSGSC